MKGNRLRRGLRASLGMLGFVAAGSAQGQDPPPIPVSSAPVKQSAAPDAGEPATVLAPPPVMISTPGGCACGDRHGVSRWWYHKTQCKRKLQECVLGYPEEFNEWPLGSSLYAHGRTQVANGNAARMVFYHYDFRDDGTELNVRGRDKLVKLAQSLPTSFAPIVIERTPKTPGLDERRRGVILAELGNFPFPVPPERVVIGPPVAAGMTGYEAKFVFGNQISNLRGGGAGGVDEYSGTPGMDGSGLSGNAINSAVGASGAMSR